MNDKLAEKRKRLDEAQARKLAGLDANPDDNSDLGYDPDDLPAGATVTSHGDVVVNGEEVDPTETNAMGQPGITNPEGSTSDVNRDADTDGDADGNPLTWGHQGIDKGIEPQTTDPRVNPQGGNPLHGEGGMKTYDPTTLPAGSPTPGVVAPTQEEGQYKGNTSEPGDLSGVSPRVSARTQAEMARGADALGRRQNENETVQQRRTIVTDVNDDPDGDKGAKAADKKAADKKAADSKKSSKK